MWYELTDLDTGKVISRNRSEGQAAVLIRQLEDEYPDSYPSDLGLSIFDDDEIHVRSLEGAAVGNWAHHAVPERQASFHTGLPNH
jgi:hypothetical protein